MINTTTGVRIPTEHVYPHIFRLILFCNSNRANRKPLISIVRTCAASLSPNHSYLADTCSSWCFRLLLLLFRRVILSTASFCTVFLRFTQVHHSDLIIFFFLKLPSHSLHYWYALTLPETIKSENKNNTTFVVNSQSSLYWNCEVLCFRICNCSQNQRGK